MGDSQHRGNRRQLHSFTDDILIKSDMDSEGSTPANYSPDPRDAEERDRKARTAGEIIYGSLTGSSPSVVAGYSYSSVSAWDRQACCGIMSPVRRTFCLFLLFDFVLMFILWLIYTQTCGMGIRNAFILEIVHYTFQDSLFDNVLCSACRFVPLLLAYALCRLRSPWPVAVTTLGTCAFLIPKVFLFNPSPESEGRKQIMAYVVMIVSFMLAWIETWFLDFKVLPRETQARELERTMLNSSHSDDERTRLLSGPTRQRQVAVGDQFQSLPESLEGSDDEGPVTRRDYHSVPASHSHSRAHSCGSLALSLGDMEKEYQDLAKEVWEFIWKVLKTDTGWRHETGTDLQTGMVYSQNFSECGKLFKLEGEVEISQETLFHELVTNISQLPKWNPTVLECRTIQAIDDNTDVAYQVAAEAAGGIVSSRDFVTLRHWGQREGIIISCGKHVGHPDMPPNKKHVRGENGPGAWVFAPVKNHPERCHFIWLLNTNLKLPGGWVAQSLADRALSGVLLDYLKYVKKRAEVLQQG